MIPRVLLYLFIYVLKAFRVEPVQKVEINKPHRIEIILDLVTPVLHKLFQNHKNILVLILIRILHPTRINQLVVRKVYFYLIIVE